MVPPRGPSPSALRLVQTARPGPSTSPPSPCEASSPTLESPGAAKGQQPNDRCSRWSRTTSTGDASSHDGSTTIADEDGSLAHVGAATDVLNRVGASSCATLDVREDIELAAQQDEDLSLGAMSQRRRTKYAYAVSTDSLAAASTLVRDSSSSMFTKAESGKPVAKSKEKAMILPSSTSSTGTVVAPRPTLLLYLCTFAASLGFMSFGYHLGEMNNVSAILPCRSISIGAVTSPYLSLFSLPPCLPMPNAAFSAANALIPIGGAIGALAGGSFAQRYGRIPCMLLFAVLGLASPVLLTLAPEYGTFLVGRTLAGLASGGHATSVPVYIAEIAPVHLRGSFGVVAPVALSVGLALAGLTGFAWSTTAPAWRSIFAVGAIPALLQILLLVFVCVESPEWLANVKNNQHAAVQVAIRLGLMTEAQAYGGDWHDPTPSPAGAQQQEETLRDSGTSLTPASNSPTTRTAASVGSGASVLSHASMPNLDDPCNSNHNASDTTLRPLDTAEASLAVHSADLLMPMPTIAVPQPLCPRLSTDASSLHHPAILVTSPSAMHPRTASRASSPIVLSPVQPPSLSAAMVLPVPTKPVSLWKFATRAEYRKAAVILAVAHSASQLSGINVYFVYSYSILTRVMSPAQANLFYLGFAFANIPLSVIPGYLSDRFGRRPLLLFSMFGMSLAALGLTLSVALQLPHVAMAMFILAVSLFACGLASVPLLLISEVAGDATAVGAASTLAQVVSTLASTLVLGVFPAVLEKAGANTFLVFSVCLAVEGGVLWAVLPETKWKKVGEAEERGGE